jgi:putative ABC transport system permease protein
MIMTMPTALQIMTGLLAAVGLIVLYLLFLSIRNPVIAKIGLRNIPRRPAQSALIVLGLTLSTVIILSSLATGDTLTYSLRSHTVKAYGKIDEIIAPPLLSALAAFADEDDASAADTEPTEAEQELQNLTEGGLTTVLTVLAGGLPGITVERFETLKAEAAGEPLIDAAAASIIFPTIIRNVTTGQGEPFGFIFAVDNDYDQEFGLTTVDGQMVGMEELQTGVGNIFAQASNLFRLVGNAGAAIGLEGVDVSDVALATAAIGAALTAGAGEEGFDLASINIDLETLRSLGIDTTALEEAGVESLNLEALGLTPETLESMGVKTTTVSLDSLPIDASPVVTFTNDLLGALNLNTLGAEIDRVLSQVGLQLRQGDVYLNRLGAERLNARPGDVLELYIGPIPIPFRVRGIVEEAGPMGALAPVVMLRLDEAQKLLFMNGKVNNVLISNAGDELAGMQHTEAVSERLRYLAIDPAAVAAVRNVLMRPAVRGKVETEAARVQESAEEEFDGPSFLLPLARSLGAFGDYIDDVRVLPTALDDPSGEQLRALLANMEVRSWLRQVDLPAQDAAALNAALATLNQFDLLDPLSKSTVVSVADIGGIVFSSLFSIFGVFSILAGVLLIFLIFVMMAAERRSEMGMARAVGVQRGHLVQMFVTEGVLYDLVAAAVGVLLGLAVSYAMVGFLGRLFNDLSTQFGGQSTLFRIQFHAAPTSIVISYCVGVLFTFVIVTLSAWRVSRLNIVAAIRDLPDTGAAARTSRWSRLAHLLSGPLLVAAGAALWWYGAPAALSLLLAALSLIVAGLALFGGWWLERTSLREEQVQRIVYTVIGVGLLILWGVPWDRWLGRAGAEIDLGGPWILLSFALTGPLFILGAILVIMFNADAWTWGISYLLGGIGALTPVLKTAIAYPLSSRFRTGMAMLLFAMIITTVTIMTVVIEATQSLVAPDSERYAGFEIQVSPSLLSFFDPVYDLNTEIAANPDFPVDEVAAVGGVSSLTVNAQQVGDEEPAAGRWRRTDLIGVDAGYLSQAAQVYTLALRAPGFADDAAVWQALAERDDVAILSANLLPAAPGPSSTPAAEDDSMTEPVDGPDNLERRRGPGDEDWDYPRLRLTGFDAASAELPDLRIALRDPDSGAPVHTVQIIGVLAQNDTLAGEGIQINQRGLELVRGEDVAPNNFYLKVREGVEVHAVAQAAERAFLGNALNATIMAESFAQGQAVTRGILQLLQGFLALGLLVGIAALGVISTRTVVERRQQVGMLRAIGFQRNMVALSFLIESSFIALTGIAVGAATGVVLGQNMVSLFFEALRDGQTFTTPWLQIGGIVLAAYAFSLLTTILPAYQAARIYPAEALRYE